jgi:hypothetical protein
MDAANRRPDFSPCDNKIYLWPEWSINFTSFSSIGCHLYLFYKNWIKYNVIFIQILDDYLAILLGRHLPRGGVIRPRAAKLAQAQCTACPRLGTERKKPQKSWWNG